MTVELKTGDMAPGFELQDQNSENVSLESFRGGKVLVYFYPKADTPGCTVQSCAVSESLAALKEAGVAAVGISPDTPAEQKKFDTKYQLGFPLLADTAHTVAEAFGTWRETSLYGRKTIGIMRSAFLIDENGAVMAVRYKISPADTVPLVKQVLGLP